MDHGKADREHVLQGMEIGIPPGQSAPSQYHTPATYDRKPLPSLPPAPRKPVPRTREHETEREPSLVSASSLTVERPQDGSSMRSTPSPHSGRRRDAATAAEDRDVPVTIRTASYPDRVDPEWEDRGRVSFESGVLPRQHQKSIAPEMVQIHNSSAPPFLPGQKVMMVNPNANQVRYPGTGDLSSPTLHDSASKIRKITGHDLDLHDEDGRLHLRTTDLQSEDPFPHSDIRDSTSSVYSQEDISLLPATEPARTLSLFDAYSLNPEDGTPTSAAKGGHSSWVPASPVPPVIEPLNVTKLHPRRSDPALLVAAGAGYHNAGGIIGRSVEEAEEEAGNGGEGRGGGGGIGSPTPFNSPESPYQQYQNAYHHQIQLQTQQSPQGRKNSMHHFETLPARRTNHNEQSVVGAMDLYHATATQIASSTRRGGVGRGGYGYGYGDGDVGGGGGYEEKPLPALPSEEDEGKGQGQGQGSSVRRKLSLGSWGLYKGGIGGGRKAEGLECGNGNGNGNGNGKEWRMSKARYSEVFSRLMGRNGGGGEGGEGGEGQAVSGGYGFARSPSWKWKEAEIWRREKRQSEEGRKNSRTMLVIPTEKRRASGPDTPAPRGSENRSENRCEVVGGGKGGEMLQRTNEQVREFMAQAKKTANVMVMSKEERRREVLRGKIRVIPEGAQV